MEAVIFSINDVYSMINLPKLFTLILLITSTGNIQNYYTTLNGDFLSPSQLSSIDEGKGMIQALNYMNMNYVCFGNHEFDVPKYSLSERINEFNGDWLSTNIQEFDGTVKYSISDKGGIKIAWLGLCMDNLDDYTRYDVKVDNTINCAKETIRHINNNYDIDAFVAVTHQDYDKDIELVKNVPEINLVLGGHEHYPIIKSINNTNIIKVGMDANSVAQIKLSKNDKKLEITYDVLNLSDYHGIEYHKEFSDLIYKLNEPVRNIINKDIFVIHEKTSTLNIRSNRDKVYLCQKILEMMKEYFDTDFSFLNSGYIRGNNKYEKDQIFTYVDMKNEFPIKNNIIKLWMKGSDILELINYSEIELIGTGGYMRFNSINYTYTDHVEITSINNKQFNSESMYSVCTSGSLLLGIDNIPVLKKVGETINHLRTVVDSGTSIYNIIMSFREFN